MSSRLASPFAHGAGTPGPLCLNQGGYYLHELAAGRGPAPDDLVLRHLRTADDIAGVQHLRSQIDLTHSAGDPRFAAEEKKEMNWGSPWHSSWMENLWVRCGPSP